MEQLTPPDGLPLAEIITILSAEYNGGSFEWIDRERQLALIDGTHYRVMDSVLEVFADA